MDRRPSGRTISVALVLLAGAILLLVEARPGSIAAQQPRAGAAAPKARSPLAAGPAPDINLAFTAQAAGWIEPCG